MRGAFSIKVYLVLTSSSCKYWDVSQDSKLQLRAAPAAFPI